MRGSNHSVMNLVTAGFVGMTGFLIVKTEAPGFLKTAVDASKNFLFDHKSLPVYFYIPLVAFVYLLGSILPDIDHPHSKIGRVIHIPVKHRTWFHAIYLPLILLIVGIFYRWVFWLALGYLFHLVWDSPSASGVDWLYPKKNKHHLVLYHTGQPSEYIFVAVFVAMFLIYLFIVLQCVYHFIG